jgi:hypothetical protein
VRRKKKYSLFLIQCKVYQPAQSQRKIGAKKKELETFKERQRQTDTKEERKRQEERMIYYFFRSNTWSKPYSLFKMKKKQKTRKTERTWKKEGTRTKETTRQNETARKKETTREN